MSRPVDPSEGGYDPSERSIDPPDEGGGEQVSADEDNENEGRVEASGQGGQHQPQGGGHEGGGKKPSASSKGINPVQHSE